MNGLIVELDSSDDEQEVVDTLVDRSSSGKRGRPIDEAWNDCREITRRVQTIDGSNITLDLEAPKRYAQCKHCGHQFGFPMMKKVNVVKEHMTACRGIHGKKLKQSVIKTVPTIPKLTHDELESFHDPFALWVYQSGTSFSRVELDSLLDALRLIRPGVTLPTRQKVANSCLSKSFDLVAGMVSHELAKSGEFLRSTLSGSLTIRLCFQMAFA